MVLLRKRGEIMRDFPVFETQYGVASLVLREIPYRKKAYIKVLDSLEPEELIRECRSFCTAVGAEKVYASGDDALQSYPLYARLLEMKCDRESLPDTTAQAVLVTEQSAAQWKEIYNDKMSDVPNASYLDTAAVKEVLSDGSGYLVYRDGQLIGIGKAGQDQIDALAATVPGAGQDVVLALAKALNSAKIRLLVAEENVRAMKLYKRLGFVVSGEFSRWYQIF